MTVRDVAACRADFPILEREVRPGVRLAYLDSAASSQKPRQVLDAMTEYYENHHANVHRGAHTLGEEATAAYEGAREKVAAFISAPHTHEVVFTRNATEALNLLAWSWGRANLQPGDRVMLSAAEHHANVVPWQQVCRERGAAIDWIELTPDQHLDLDTLLLTDRTKLVSVAGVSNVLGTINPITEIARRAHEAGAVCFVDGAQWAPHLTVDVTALGVDAFVATGHKMCGPTGIGFLWAREALLDSIPPFLTGGEMVATVTRDGATWAALPAKFEAGTPPIAEAVGLGAAVDYLGAFGMDAIRAHERNLVEYTLKRLGDVEGLTLYGPDDPDARSGAFSFTYRDIHPHDLATVLDERGVAIRAGHHCAKPLMATLGVIATARASIYLYSLPEEIDQMVEGLGDASAIFGV